MDANQTGFHTTASADDLERHFIDWHLRALSAGFRVDPTVVAKSCRYCDTVGGRDGAVVSADGKLYSCWDSVGQSGFEVGDLDAGYGREAEIAERWVSCGSRSGRGPAGEVGCGSSPGPATTSGPAASRE